MNQISDGTNVAVLKLASAVADVGQLGVPQCCQFSLVLTVIYYLLRKCLLILFIN